MKMAININKTTQKEVNCININGNEETDPAIQVRLLIVSFQQLYKK